MVETLGEGNLLLIELFELGQTEVFGDALKVFFGAVEKRDTDMGLLEGADVVGAIAAHEGGVAGVFEASENVFLRKAVSMDHTPYLGGNCNTF